MGKRLPEVDAYIENAAKFAQPVALNEKGSKSSTSKRKKSKQETVDVPADLKTACARNKKARATFDRFSPSHKKEYVEWITEAKRDETRKRRLATAIEWMAEGKSRNWKYMRKK